MYRLKEVVLGVVTAKIGLGLRKLSSEYLQGVDALNQVLSYNQNTFPDLLTPTSINFLHT